MAEISSWESKAECGHLGMQVSRVLSEENLSAKMLRQQKAKCICGIMNISGWV